jgi:hypothetical protein
MATPDPALTHWPNLPQMPWRWFAEWGGGQPFRQVGSGDANDPGLFCITSIHLASQADITYFDLILIADEQSEPVFRVIVPATSSLSFAFPTPLVVGGARDWSLICGPLAAVGLFEATLVGYWRRPDPDDPPLEAFARRSGALRLPAPD